ncbi:MAG: hypothetical protein EPO32_04740 [Anaerolineae bacterium]|nr:MAG: hypothetical protein EPO32_04740 [Anaerolineae bacterium]
MRSTIRLLLILAALLAGCSTPAAVDIQPQIEAALTELAATPSPTVEVMGPPATPATPANAPTAQPRPPLEPGAPRGDGTYLVGPQMARGRWVSDGAAEGECYWTTRHADGIILQRYLGAPGGEITLGEYDYEVQFENCGTWDYVGP